MSAEQLDNILLVGGSTRIPLVQRMLYEHTGIEPVIAINPDEAVALGAGVQAAVIAGEPIEAILVDVTPHSLGIAVAELEFGQIVPDRYSVIIPRNTTIPTSRSEIYSALFPEQTAIEIKIYQGEQPIASQNTLLGEFLFEDLRPEAPGQPPRVTVEFDFDVDGLLHVSAVDRGSGKHARTSVRAAHTRLTPGEIAGARDSLEELEIAGWEAADLDEKSGVAEQESAGTPAEMSLETIGLLTRAHRALDANPDNTALREAIDRLRHAAQGGSPDDVVAQSEALLDILYELEE
jgi:molecular chaperone DnaK